MLHTCAIIAEYNPFHNGHAWQIAEAKHRGAKRVVAIMSGNFVQRGTPAVLPKEIRVAAALSCGADLVVELPLPYATASAEQFAAAGVHLAASLGVVDTLVFGAETPNVSKLIGLTRTLLDPVCDAAVKTRLSGGISYPAARAQAAEAFFPGAAEILSLPNNILAIEYCKALISQNVPVLPLPLARKEADHHDEKAGRGYASSSFLRSLSVEMWKELVPEKVFPAYHFVMDNGLRIDSSRFEIAALSRLRWCKAAGLGSLPGASEGLENALYNSIQTATSLEEVYSGAKSKRYAHSRIRRLVLAAVLGIPNVLPALPPYIRILGATETGLAMLKEVKEKSTLPFSASLAELEREGIACAAVASAEVRGGDFYSLCLKKPRPAGKEYTFQLIKA